MYPGLATVTWYQYQCVQILWNTPCPYRVAHKHCSLTASYLPFQCICADLVKLSGLLYCWFETYKISVLLCICKTTSGLLLVTHSCPVRDTWRSQTASKILYFATNKHKSLTNFLAPFMLYLFYMSHTKSTLERVSNAVYCCINDVFCELRHDSAMNIILRPCLSSW